MVIFRPLAQLSFNRFCGSFAPIFNSFCKGCISFAYYPRKEAALCRHPLSDDRGLLISLYFHIPFCSKKCPYCHFYTVPNAPHLQKALAFGFEREWDLRLPELRGKTIASIYFGGGTPALFDHEELHRILKRIEASCQLAPGCEITIEANPEHATLHALETFRSIGINRLSLGAQSFDDDSLQTLGRNHSAARCREAIAQARQAGFDNISIDLMYDLPRQSKESWKTTLLQIESLPIEHVSLYNLTLEPHTVFFKYKDRIERDLPSPELSLELLNSAVESLESFGFLRYEISAFAKPGKHSVHNLGYWTGRAFLGFGPSAFSYWNGKRFRNQANLLRYRRCLEEGTSCVDFEEELRYPESFKELLAVRLRLAEGAFVDSEKAPQDTIDTLDRLQNAGYLKKENSIWRLTARGMLFYDTVAAEIV